MPPSAPNAALDARFAGDLRAATGDEALIRLQSSRYPVIIRPENLPQTDEFRFSLLEMANGAVTAEHALREGRSIEISDPFVTVLQLQKNVVAATPSAFTLEQNYPNPFNPVTEIRYALPEKSDVKLSVYNMLGQKIRTLIDREQAAGFYSIRWDATNDQKQKVASGIFCIEFPPENIRLLRN